MGLVKKRILDIHLYALTTHSLIVLERPTIGGGIRSEDTEKWLIKNIAIRLLSHLLEEGLAFHIHIPSYDVHSQTVPLLTTVEGSASLHPNPPPRRSLSQIVPSHPVLLLSLAVASSA